MKNFIKNIKSYSIKNKYKVIFVVILLILLSTLLIADLFSGKFKTGSTSNTNFFNPPTILPIHEELYIVGDKKVNKVHLQFTSTLKPNSIRVDSPVAGDVDSAVELDSNVNSGSICVKLVSIALEKEVQAAKKELRYAILANQNSSIDGLNSKKEEINIRLKTANEQLEWLKKEAFLAEKLFDKGFVSERELYQARLAVKNAESQLKMDAAKINQEIEKTKVDIEDVSATVEATKSRLNDAMAKVAALDIACPITGKVIKKQVPAKGFKVTEGATLLEIQSKDSPFIFSFDITQQFKQYFKIHQMVSLIIQGGKNDRESFSGVIHRIDLTKDKNPANEYDNMGKSSFTIDVLPQNGVDVQLGQTALIEIAMEQNGFTLTPEYVLNTGVNYYVYMQSSENSKQANLRLVTASPFRDGFIIINGIKSGDALLQIPTKISESAKQYLSLRSNTYGVN